MLNKKVKEIMTSDVITTTADIDVVYAFEKLMEHKISSLPVVEDDDKLIGIITATDVGHNLILDKYELGTSVEEIMIKSVSTISPEDSLETAIKLMKEDASSGILNQLPVVEDGKLVGIISDGDIIQEIF